MWQHMHKELIDTMPFFCEGDDMFRTQLCVGLKSILLLPKRYVYLHGEVGKEMYLVVDGPVDVVDWQTGCILARLDYGEYFGERAGAFGDFRRRETTRASGMCHLLALSYDHMKVKPAMLTCS
eukprot:3555476-Pyramimonas_sp.AAC.1